MMARIYPKKKVLETMAPASIGSTVVPLDYDPEACEAKDSRKGIEINTSTAMRHIDTSRIFFKVLVFVSQSHRASEI